MSSMTKKVIGEYEITINNNWCVVRKDNKEIFSDNVEKNVTPEMIYKYVTAKVEFLFEGKVISSYDLLSTFEGERESTRELLAYDRNCDKEEIKTRVKYEEIPENLM